VALYNRNFEQKDISVLQHIVTRLESFGIRLTVFKDFYERLEGKVSFGVAPLLFTGKKDLPVHTEMLFSLGGDGTLLDTVIFVADSNVPILGINFGRLGFLAAIPSEEAEIALLSLV